MECALALVALAFHGGLAYVRSRASAASAPSAALNLLIPASGGSRAMPHDTTPYFVRRTFLTGLLILIPLFVTYVLIAFLFHLLTTTSAPVMHGVFRLLGLDRYPWDPLGPRMNLLLSLAVIFVLGLIGTNILGRRLLHMVDALLLRLPLVKRVYGAVKHVVDTFQGPHRSFPRVVQIEYPRQGLWTISLVAAERGNTLHLTPSPSVLTVYTRRRPIPRRAFW
jgi:uncharacterized membrane protein